jgi:UDP-glucuronate decarboxylase
VSNFISQALKSDDITIYGTGSQTRSFCYVEDMVDGLIKLMDSADSLTGPVNLGNPSESTMIEIADQIIEMSGSQSKKIFMDLPQDDPKQRKPDISRAQELLGWTPKASLQFGLKQTISYFRSI